MYKSFIIITKLIKSNVRPDCIACGTKCLGGRKNIVETEKASRGREMLAKTVNCNRNQKYTS